MSSTVVLYEALYIRKMFLNMFCILLLSAGISHTAGAQTGTEGWDALALQYKQGKIDDTTYLKKAEALAEKSFKSAALKKYLTHYQKIAWSKKQYRSYRIRYYSMLANNATFSHQDGVALYYIQKSEQELQQNTPYFPSLSEPRFLLTVYGKNEQLNIAQRKTVFIKVLPFLKGLPQLIRDHDIPINTGLNAMTILNNASRLYAQTNDRLMVLTIQDIAAKVYHNLKAKNPTEQEKIKQCLFLDYQVRYTAALMLQDISRAKNILDSSYHLLRAGADIRQIWARSAERALIRKYIDFFIDQGQTDSSRYYMQVLSQKINKNDPGDGTAQLRYAAKVNALEHEFLQAYKDLLAAYEINDSVISLKTADINNNMYALLTAEEKQQEVLQLKIQKQKRNMIVAIASILAAACIALLYLQMKRKERKARKKIETLRHLTQIEIAELEIRANTIQKKLGMELHDDIAGRLVSLGYFIEQELMDEGDPLQLEKLQAINQKVKETYHSTREKSHEWYAEGIKEEQGSFAESVHKLATYALPDEQFEKTIDIDNPSLQKVSHTIKIELLRIIQEALINILKHSGAHKVQLFMYEEEHTLSLQITDNGRGFNPKELSGGKSLGLQSLRERVQDMKGSMVIHSTKEGTELMVEVPVK